MILLNKLLQTRCLSKSGLVVGDLEHLAQTPNTTWEEVETFGDGDKDPYGCKRVTRMPG